MMMNKVLTENKTHCFTADPLSYQEGKFLCYHMKLIQCISLNETMVNIQAMQKKYMFLGVPVSSSSFLHCL